MLILMRRAGESIHIGPNIIITLVSLDRNRARIGIQAPRDVTVDREEIAMKKLNGIPPPPAADGTVAAHPKAAAVNGNLDTETAPEQKPKKKKTHY